MQLFPDLPQGVHRDRADIRAMGIAEKYKTPMIGKSPHIKLLIIMTNQVELTQLHLIGPEKPFDRGTGRLAFDNRGVESEKLKIKPDQQGADSD